MKHALRLFQRNPGFTAISIFTLALGIGATTAMFAVVNSVLIEPLPYPDADRLVHVWEVGADGGLAMPSDPNFEDVRELNRSFDSLAQYSGTTGLSVRGLAVQATAALVGDGFFETLGVGPVMGRTPLPDEQGAGARRVAVVSQTFWRERLGGATDLSALTFRIDDETYQVIGVMPPGFAFPSDAEVWARREPWIGGASGRTGRNSRVLARLSPGTSLEQARQDLSEVASRLKARYGEDTWMVDAAVVPLKEDLVGQVRPALLVQLGAVGFLLVVASVNVLNLLLARLMARGRELAVRTALGAGRWRLVRQFVTEAGVLSLAGSALGLVLADRVTAALRATQPADLPRVDELTLGWPALLFALGASVLVSAALGCSVAVRGNAMDLRASLQEERSDQPGAMSRGLRHALVGAQIAVTLVLLVGAGLLARSLWLLLETAPGFHTSSVATLTLYQPPPADDVPVFGPQEAGDALKARRVQQLDAVMARLRALPGVREVGLTSGLPLTGSAPNGMFAVTSTVPAAEGWDDFAPLFRDPSRTGSADYLSVSEGFFRAMGVPLVRGRLFDERDTIDAPHVAAISQRLAETRWPDRDPLGLTIEFGNMDGDLRLLTIVGIVGDVRDRGLDSVPSATVYTCYRQRVYPSYTFVMHTNGDAAALNASATEAVRGVVPDVPTRFGTIADVLGQWLAWRRFLLLLLAAFAVTALLVAVAGVYGAVSYAVRQRTHELGVRAALGAAPRDMTALVVRQAAPAIAGGIAAGSLLAFAVTGVLRAQLFGIGPADPLTFVGAGTILAAVALIACLLPARRASRVDALVALRGE